MTSLDVEIAETYWLAITHIEAREALLLLSISDHPHMKKEPRKRFVSELVRETKRFEEDSLVDSGPVMSTEEVEIRLRAILGK